VHRRRVHRRLGAGRTGQAVGPQVELSSGDTFVNTVPPAGDRYRDPGIYRLWFVRFPPG
jgi:hypothetical protein